MFRLLDWLSVPILTLPVEINHHTRSYRWAARVQIALDSAGCLEYIHEHTVPVYIHRDIKSANILIDKNYRAKVWIVNGFSFRCLTHIRVIIISMIQVADFGLTKLIEVGNTSLPPTHGIVGTFGYMPPEYVSWTFICHCIFLHHL